MFLILCVSVCVSSNRFFCFGILVNVVVVALVLMSR